VLTRYRKRKDPYTRDIYRYSIYPRTPRPSENLPNAMSRNEEAVVEIRDVDDKGRGVSVYKGRTIYIYGGATVGDKVRIRIERVYGDHAIARVLEWVREDNVEY
jgi:predicted RNA-binding protein with TRAM domain